GAGGALGELAHLLGDDGKTLARFAGTRGLDAGVERQKIRLEGDLVDDGDDLADLVRGLLDAAHRADRIAHDVARLFGALRRLADHGRRLVRPLRRILDGGGDLLEG